MKSKQATATRSPIIDLQIVCEAPNIPTMAQFNRWVAIALPTEKRHWELTIRVVEPAESQALNAAYRGLNRPTNVLSFASDLPDFVDETLLGDLVICASIVEQEALEQQKFAEAHWAHIIVHGTLHLLGYDHIEDADADEMEALETLILANLGFPDPYKPAIDNANSAI
jgi:probable rRNA maturation factor